jgi:predicted Zn-dependent peptidase
MKTERSELPSGAVVLSERLPGAQSVAFGLHFPTGSRDETPGTNGISHLIEHMSFKGTPSRSAEEINREIDLLGGGANAYTSKETLCFHARVLPEHLPRVVALLADLAAHALPAGAEAELERERGVILSEIASIEDSPEDLAPELSDRAYFGEHPLALPVVGCRSAVERLGLAVLRSHLARHLVAPGLVIAAAGDVEHGALAALVAEHLADLPRGGPSRALEPPVPRGGAACLERDFEQVHVCLSARGVSRGDERRFALEVLSAAVGEGCSSRLFREVRERRGLAYTIYSSLASYRDAGSFQVSFGVDPGRLEETLGVVLGVLSEVRRSGLTSEEVDLAKRQLRTAIRLAHESAGVRMAHLAERALLGREDTEVEALLLGVERVSAAEVASLAEEVLASPLAAGVAGPLAPGSFPRVELEVSA